MSGASTGLFEPANDLDRHVGRFYGKYPGIVTDVSDPLKLGRIMVQVPSVFTLAEPQWARPCFPSGHFFVPPVDAKVWVEFEAGDISYPLWVGTWHPQGDVPEEADKADATSRVIHTPSGHVVEFSDLEGEEKIVLRHKLNAYISIDKKGSLIMANPNGSLVYLNADDGEITIVSEHGHRVLMNGSTVSVTHADGSFLNLTGSEATLSAKTKVQVMANEVAITGGAVSLGPTAAMHVLVSELFDVWFKAHTHPTAVGPTGPAIAAPSLVASSQSLKVSP